MGSAFSPSTSQSSQSSANQQVGVQGGIGVGAATSGSVAAGSGASSLQLGNVGAGSNVTVISPDESAITGIEAVAQDALGVTGAVALQSVNYAQQNVTNALSVVEADNAEEGTLASQAQSDASQLSNLVAPQSAASTAETLNAQNTKSSTTIAIVTGVAGLIGLWYINRRKA